MTITANRLLLQRGLAFRERSSSTKQPIKILARFIAVRYVSLRIAAR